MSEAKMRKDSAIEVIIGMKRYYGLKKDKYEIDKEVERLASKYNITYGDIWKYKEQIKKGLIKPYWK